VRIAPHLIREKRNDDSGCRPGRAGLVAAPGPGRPGPARKRPVNFFGFAAISALVGLFSPEAAEKLKLIFSTLLAPVPHERDSLPPGPDARTPAPAGGRPQGSQAAPPGNVAGSHGEDQPAAAADRAPG